MIVRGKYYISGVQHDRSQHNDAITVKVHFNAVCSYQKETENARFFASTPSGTICLSLTPEEVADKGFQPGQYWYVDHAPVPDDPKSPGMWQICEVSTVKSSYHDVTLRRLGMTLHPDHNNEERVGLQNEAVKPLYSRVGSVFDLTFTPTTKEGS